MRSQRNLHRRGFLKSSAAAMVGAWAAPEIVSSAARGGGSSQPASERIALAFIGPGNRGRGLIKEFASRAEVEVLAVADVIGAQRERAMQLIRELVEPVKPAAAGLEIRGRRRLLPVPDARRLLRRPLKYDPVRVEFPGDDQANRLLDYPKRSPWRIY